MKGWQEFVAVFGLFLVLTAVLTFPLVLSLPTAIADPGDPLLNSWIMAWDVHALLTDPLNLFDANIFHPHRLTLAYSDHLLGTALLAAPVFLATGQALLAHNVVLFLSFPLSGLGMYYLARHLTGHRGASLIAALIFAFAPYRFGHLSHLPLLTAQWIPLTLLFLHRSLEGGGRWRDVLAVGGFFTLQGLSGGYYAYYLTLSVAFVLGVSLWLWGRPAWALVPRLAVAGAASGLVLLPFLLPYVAVRQAFGFVRTFDEVLAYSARLESYLAAPASNWLYGAATEAFRRPERMLFLGLVPLGLALVGVGARQPAGAASPAEVPGLASAGSAPPDPPHSRAGLIRAAAGGLEGVVLVGLVLAVVGCLGGLTLALGPLRISSHTVWRPLVMAAAVNGLRWGILGHRVPLASLEALRGWLGSAPWPPIYAGLGLLAGLFSLGPALEVAEGGTAVPLPYLCFYQALPGFDGLRVPARLAILVLVALAVLAAFGVARLARRAPWGHAVSGVVALAIALEFLSVPIPLGHMPAEVPPVYRWLAEQPGESVVVELPFPSPSQAHWETRRLYYSTVHWKRLVNGYSGYFPPGYWERAERLQAFPGSEAVALLRELGVRYAVLHVRPDRDWWEQRMTVLDRLPPGLSIVARFPDAVVVDVGGKQ